jgi:hypothetical protein
MALGPPKAEVVSSNLAGSASFQLLSTRSAQRLALRRGSTAQAAVRVLWDRLLQLVEGIVADSPGGIALVLQDLLPSPGPRWDNVRSKHSSYGLEEF